MKWLIFLGFLAGLVSMPENHGDLNRYVIRGTAQGTTYQLIYYATDSLVTKTSIDSLFANIDSSLSIYKSYSLISQFNASSRGVLADQHLKKIVVKAQETNTATKGIFDITILPVTEAWGFAAKTVVGVPGKYRIKNLMKCVGAKKIVWKGDSLIKLQPCVRLDPNGIGQGYSADLLASFLEQQGINNYVAEIGGEMRVRGVKVNNQPFLISIEKTSAGNWEIDNRPRQIAVANGAITSSGSYRKFINNNGKQSTHIIDARTGGSIQNELLSVTVFAKDAITADAYDNSFMAMGLQKSLAFCKKNQDLAAYFVYKKKDGSIADTATENFPKFINNYKE